MPKKIRELKSMLRKAGFSCKPGKDSLSKWKHPKKKEPVVLSGKDGVDAKSYQEKEVQEAIKAVQKKKK